VIVYGCGRLRRLTFVILFVIITYIVGHILGLITDWLFSAEKYRQPYGKAVKVFQLHHTNKSLDSTFMGRLWLYYWLGE